MYLEAPGRNKQRRFGISLWRTDVMIHKHWQSSTKIPLKIAPANKLQSAAQETDQNPCSHQLRAELSH